MTRRLDCAILLSANGRQSFAGERVARLQTRAITRTRWQEFERLAEVETNDLRLVFNAGAAAYRATNFDAALNDFQTVTLSPDLKLQQQAYYNLGNTLYRHGRTKFEPDTEGLDAMEETWQQAVKSYEHAAELNTNDADAAYNLAFVKKQIGLIAAASRSDAQGQAGGGRRGPAQ